MLYFSQQIQFRSSLRKGKLRVIEGRKTVRPIINAGQAGYRKT